MKRVLLTLVGLAIVCLLFPASSSAVSTQNIGIAPAIVSHNLDPGSAISGDLNLTNLGVNSYNYSIYATPYGVVNETYQPVFKPLPGFTSIANWFSFNQTRGYLKPAESTVINYKLSVPAGTPPGSYYGAVFAQTNSTFRPGHDQIQIKQRVGSLFYINVNGQAYQHGSVSSWSAALFQSKPVTASLRLSNSGKLYYVTNINVNFEDIFGNVKYSYYTQKIVVPKVVRDIPIAWPKPPIFGLYKVRGTATLYGKKQLSTHYILIASSAVRIIFIIIVIALMMYLGLQNILLNLFRSKSKGSKK